MLARAAIYLDANAAAPLQPQVVKELQTLFQDQDELLLANPSSAHALGRQARSRISEAKERISLSLGLHRSSEQLILTSSGSEANQLAIRSVLEPLLDQGQKPHWITTPVEHDSVLQMTRWLEARGGRVSFLPVDNQGRPNSQVLQTFWRPDTALISLIWVNNETGVISDVASISEQARIRGVPFHLDGAQAWGKIPLDLLSSGASYVSFSGHKIGALPGSGCLWTAPGARVTSLILGKQEHSRRGGTENFLSAVAMGVAAMNLDPKAYAEDLVLLRDRLEDLVLKKIPGASINGRQAPRVGNTSSLTFEGAAGDSLVMALDLAGYAVSTGSACSSLVSEPSHVLMAMGRTRDEAKSSIRVSLPRFVRWEELEGFVTVLEKAVAKARAGRAALGEGARRESFQGAL